MGRDRKTGEIRKFPIDAYKKIIEVNQIGTFRCIVGSAAGMLELEKLDCGDRGAMVMTASVAAEDGQMGQVAYSASKGAIVAMTLPIARDFASEGIRINTILPGLGPPSPAAGRPRRVCGPGDVHARDRLLQRRGRSPRRRHPHGASLMRRQGFRGRLTFA